MRKPLALGMSALIGMAGVAYAADRAQDNAAERAVPVEQMKTDLERLGYDVRNVEKEDGAYEVQLIDRDFGGRVKAHFDAKTGELTRAKPAHVDRKTDEDDEAGANEKHHEDRD